VGRHQLFKKKKRCSSSSSSSSCVKKKCTTKVNKNRFEEEDTHTQKNVFFFQNFFPNKLSQNESLGSLKISQKIFFLALKEKPLRKKKKKKCRRRRRREKKEKNKGKKCPRR